ncbi:hypothetical protein ACFX2I_022129 [Malus domestica]|uniref:F-box protein CPR1-like n=1 Tax=Malus domestica TaxID=3750 RepID=UPI0039768242
MSSFPPELVVDILSWLAPEDLIRCMCVCKAWNAFIRGENFIKSHLQRSIQTNSTRSILLTSSDSVLFSLPFGGKETFGSAVKIVPALKDTWILRLGCTLEPLPPLVSGRSALYGFGYDSANADYNLVGVIEFYNSKNVIVSSRVELYSLKSNSWKSIQNMPCDGFKVYPICSRRLLFISGALCWLMHNNTNWLIILSLDLASEKYGQFSTPYVGNGRTYLLLDVLRGYLCFCVNYWSARHDVWIMKEYGVAESWTFLFSVEMKVLPMGFDLLCKPLVFSENGDMVLLTNDNGGIYWYDLEKKNFKRVEIHGEPSTYTATVCVGSLCLLDGDYVVAERQ